MAQIKDLIVLGAARILNKIYASEFIGKLTGNADTATKATQDESGNNIKSSYASSISISDHTITLKNKNGTSLGTVNVPDTNTWRGIQDNLTSTSTTDSLSANQGRLLANGSARDNTKLPLSGGTMTGAIHIKGVNGQYNENIRIYPSNSNWTSIVMCGNDNTNNSGTSAKTWGLFTYDGTFSIAKNGTNLSNNIATASLVCNSNNEWIANGNAIIHSGNYKSYCTPANIGAAASSHTHNYAGSSSAGGSATSAVKLDSSAGSATQPVYFSGGKPVACTYTLGKSVPSDAVFTDTNTWRGIQDNLTSTSTTDSLSANQGRILANGGAKDSTKLPLSGGTMSGTAFISWPDSGNWSNSNSGVTFPVKRGGLSWSGQSDYIEMYSEETASDNLELVIKFGDDNSNGISIRNASGAQTARISATGVFTGSFSGNATSATSAISVIDYNNSSRAIKIGYDGAGATTSNLAYIAGYLTSGTQIKDVSKSVLKSWLNIDALAGYATGVCTAGVQTVTPVSGAKYVLAIIWVPHTTSIGSGDCNIGTSMLTGNEYTMIDARTSNYALIVKTTTDNKVIISVPDNCYSFTSYQYTIFTFK